MTKKIKFFLIISILLQFIYIIEKKIEFEPIYLLSSFKKDFKGKLNLPRETLEIKKIITEKNIDTYNLSKKFKDNNLIYQRTVEYLYPIKIVNNQNIFFEFINESNDNCIIEAKYEFTQISKFQSLYTMYRALNELDQAFQNDLVSSP